MRTFRDAGITGDFVHEPLQHPGSEIRLIHIKPSDVKNDEIECTISTHDLGKAPPFAAISYTWGDMASMRDIRLDGKHLSIGENNWFVLWQARLHKIPLPVWIDVLSINQSDDDEKSSQVGIMASIYAAAKFTCVGLGPQENDSEFLAREIRDHTYHIEHVLSKSSEPAACGACGCNPASRMYRCKQCDDGMSCCIACKSSHVVHAGHDLYLDVRTDSHHRGLCIQCEQPLSTKWYQPKDSLEGRLMKTCEDCVDLPRNRTSDDSWNCEYGRMNEWEHVIKPQGLSRFLQYILETSKRLFDKPWEDHVKIADALRLLSIRPYFTRLWVVQEIGSSSSVAMVCGEDLFHFWELDAILRDVRGKPRSSGTGRYQQRDDELGTRGMPSVHFDLINSQSKSSAFRIWDLVHMFSSHYCSDTRDRVFGLIAIADWESSETLSPDYTKSATAVLLQLIESQAEFRNAWKPCRGIDFPATRNVIGAFGFDSGNSDIAAMRDRRRTVVPGGDTPSDLGFHRLYLKATLPCTVWKNDAGEMVAPLLKQNRAKNPTRHDFSTGQGATAGAIELHSLDGSVVGLANKDIQPGDTVLFFELSDGDDKMLPSGLIVREHFCEKEGTSVATIVGQCIVDSDVGGCEGGSGCLCRDARHCWEGKAWQVLMSPEDLLVFIAQDLKLIHRQPSEFEALRVEISVQLEKSRERLTTRVSSGSSSYAIAIPIELDE